MKIKLCEIDKEFAKYLLPKFERLTKEFKTKKKQRRLKKVLELFYILIEDKYDSKQIKKGLRVLSKHYKDFWS
jgi:hypothetical protein